MPAARRESHEGFTLIELLVVLLVVGVTLSVIVPQFAATKEDAALRATARRLIAMLRLARSQAVTTSSAARVRIDDEERTFWLETLGDDGAGNSSLGAVGDPPRVFLPDTAGPSSRGEYGAGLGIEVRTPRGSPSAGGFTPGPPRSSGAATAPSAVVFHPDGTAEDKEIVIANRRGDELRLKVERLTARIRVEDEESSSGRRP